MSTFKKCQVVMLSTRNKSKIAYSDNHRKLILGDFETTYNEMIGRLTKHLYITSDDEIKEGDWCVVKHHTWNLPIQVDKIENNMVVFKTNQVIILNQLINDCKKIIATTDSSLILDISNGTISGKHTLHVNLPKPSQSFIEKYIQEYNKGNIITDVLVEHNHKGIIERGRGGQRNITIKKVKDNWTTDQLLGNGEDSLDNYLLNSESLSQEDRELIMEAVFNWTQIHL